jgi:ATP-dependent protease Clp ATPase subunit
MNENLTEKLRDNPPDACCSFCKKPRHETGPMVEGPNQIYICPKCVDEASRIVQQMRQEGRLWNPSKSTGDSSEF